MKRKLKNRLLLLFFLFFAKYYAQHDQVYGLYMFNGAVINPAYCGSNGVMNSTLNYKNQWTGFGVAPKTLVFTVHSPLKNDASNVGILFSNDRFGITSKNRFSAAYAHALKLNKEITLRFGLQTGIESFRNNYDKLTVIEASDVAFTGDNKVILFMGGAGAYVTSPEWFAGLSSPVLFSTKNNSRQIYRPVFAYGGYRFKINEEFTIQPSLLIRYIKNSPSQMDISGLVEYRKKMGAGLSLRTNRTIVTNLFYNVNDQFFIGYSLDLNTGQLSQLAKVSNEITLRYIFGYSKELQNPRNFY